MMLKTRNYLDNFIEIKTDEIETTLHNKKQAKEFRQNLMEVIDDLDSFIENADD